MSLVDVQKIKMRLHKPFKPIFWDVKEKKKMDPEKNDLFFRKNMTEEGNFLRFLSNTNIR